jgi:hypothetical protein
MQSDLIASLDLPTYKGIVLKSYQDLPSQMTGNSFLIRVEWKREHVMSEYSFNQRLLGLGFSCLLITGVSFKGICLVLIR